MVDIKLVIIFSLIGGLASLIGGFLLLKYRHIGGGVANYAAPFAAGSLIAAAFLDLLPEAINDNESEQPLFFAMIGILLFFLLERYLRWFHHHHEHGDNHGNANVLLVVIGDTIHNVIDGIVLGAAFLVDSTTGVIATMAVAAHEVPQEIGDFGILLKKGLSNKKIILVNIFSAFATTLAAVIMFSFGRVQDVDISPLLGLAAGFFIYIAVSDIIPSIHNSENKKLIGAQSAMLIIGAIVVGVMAIILE